MSLCIESRWLSVYLVLGSVYIIRTDMLHRSALRVSWRGRRIFSLGHSPSQVW